VVVAFKEDFGVALPLDLRPPGTADERTTLLRMQLLVQPETAETLNTPVTATGEDWIVAHRSSPIFEDLIWGVLVSRSRTKGSAHRSLDLFRGRLAALTQRAASTCNLADPRRVVGPVLIAEPQGASDPDDPARALWPEAARFTATVRQEGAGFVDRRSFEPADATAFDFALDTTAGGAGAWSVAGGALQVSAGGGRRFAIFGEPAWNHVAIQIGVRLDGQAAGVGVALPAGGLPARGLFAVVERVGTGHRLALYRRESGSQLVAVTQSPLPALSDPGAPVTLRVFAFDDRLRASVGEVSLEADRGELREGRLCLVADGAAQFASLQVTGLDMLVFPFAISRYRSFVDHIQSYPGVLDEIAPGTLGPGTTTATTAGLWAATQADVQAAMQPASPAGARQAVFDRWVQGLGLPLKDDVTGLEISRFVASGQTEFFLLESPEPLDFTEEVGLALARRRWVGGGVADAGDTLALRAVLPRRALRDELALSQSLREGGRAGRDLDLGPGRSRGLIVDVRRGDGELWVELDLAVLATLDLRDRRIVFIEVLGREPARRLRFYAGSLPARRGARTVTVRAEETDELLVRPGGGSTLVSGALADFPTGSIVAVTPDLSRILDWFRPHFVYDAIDVRVIQDGAARRAIVLPVSGGGVSPLPGGLYRLSFKLERRRWATTEPPDDLNTYRRETALQLNL
jgi:hypothetical protein